MAPSIEVGSVIWKSFECSSFLCGLIKKLLHKLAKKTNLQANQNSPTHIYFAFWERQGKASQAEPGYWNIRPKKRDTKTRKYCVVFSWYLNLMYNDLLSMCKWIKSLTYPATSFTQKRGDCEVDSSLSSVNIILNTPLGCY